MTAKIKSILVAIIVILLVANSVLIHGKLKKTLADSKDVVEALSREFDKLKIEKLKLEEALEQQKTSAEEMAAERNRLRDELAGASGKLTEKTSELEKKTAEIDSLKAQIKKTKSGYADPTKDRAEELKQQLEQKLKMTTTTK